MGLGRKCEGVTFELVDLRDYPMPFFDQPKSPLREPSKNEMARKWAQKVRDLDGFIFVTGEYNHGIPAVLKNAIDHVYAEFNRKPERKNPRRFLREFRLRGEDLNLRGFGLLQSRRWRFGPVRRRVG